MDAAGSLKARTDLPNGGCSARCCKDGASAASGMVPDCLEPELTPASAGLQWRAANVTCLAPSQSGGRTRGEFVLQSHARELVQCPFSLPLQQPVQSKPLQGGRPKPWECPSSRDLPSFPPVGKLLLTQMFNCPQTVGISHQVLCSWQVEWGCWQRLSGREVTRGVGCPPSSALLCQDHIAGLCSTVRLLEAG